MNTNLRTTQQHQATSSEPHFHSDGGSTGPILHSNPSLHPNRRRNGKVASLPKPHRDLVNHMLEDGVAYKEIVAALAQLGHSVSPRNISNWYQGGYQDWLLHQERLAANRIREEAVLDILTNNHDVDLPAAGLQVAATHLCQLLLAAHPETADPESGLNNYIRVANSLCRISRQLMKVQEFRDQYPAATDEPDDPDESDPGDPKTEPLSSSELEVQDAQSNGHEPSSAAGTSLPVASSMPPAFVVQSSEFNVPGSSAPTSPAQPSTHSPLADFSLQPLALSLSGAPTVTHGSHSQPQNENPSP